MCPLTKRVGRRVTGSPQLMNDLAEGYFCLPSEWFIGKSDIFIVEVKGDSMKDADINDGDMVVVEKRDEAKNRDIVVVAMGDETKSTLSDQKGILDFYAFDQLVMVQIFSPDYPAVGR